MSKSKVGKPETVQVSAFFRSQTQMMILAKVILGQVEVSITEIAKFANITKSAVSREVTRLVDQNILSITKQGKNIMVTSKVTGPILDSLQTLLMNAVGPLQVLPIELAGIQGIDEIYIFGSWAQRLAKTQGTPPKDIDLLVIGDPDMSLVSEAAKNATKKLNMNISVNPLVVTKAMWEDSENQFLMAVKEKNLVRILQDDAPLKPDTRNNPIPQWPSEYKP